MESAPDYGYCAAQKLHYFGYKIHTVCTVQGALKAFGVSKAYVHDIHYLNDVSKHIDNYVLIGEKGYINQYYQTDIFNHHGIYRKARKRIETLFSRLFDQFMNRRNYAKSFAGFATCVLAKITALTLIQWGNKLSDNKINNLKIDIS